VRITTFNTMAHILARFLGVACQAEHILQWFCLMKLDLAKFCRTCDPTGSFNPGIGKMPKSEYSADKM